MMSTLKAKDKAFSLFPACIHVDGTSRVQVVNERLNPILFELLSKFYEATGVPALLNTSFNLRGEPIVNSASDVIKTFLSSGLKALFLSNIYITKTRTST